MMSEKLQEKKAEMEPLISVIVPVYHSEKTLRRCVASILQGQDYENVELLLVANGLGEEDEALRLCRELSAEDTRIRLLVLERAGVSAARNAGIREAKGELIRFVDSDDALPAGSLRLLYDCMKKDESDLVIGGYEHLYYGKSVMKIPAPEGCFSFRDDPDAFAQLYFTDYLNPPWNKLYKKSLITGSFPEDMSLGEDLCFNLEYLTGAGKVSVLAGPVCIYGQGENEGSLSGTARTDRIPVCMDLYKKSVRYFEKMELPPSSVTWAAETKVVSTFLDEIGMTGRMELPLQDKKRRVRSFVKAIHRFCSGKKREIRLRYADHKILFPFAAGGHWLIVLFLTQLRGGLIRLAGHFRKGRKAD